MLYRLDLWDRFRHGAYIRLLPRVTNGESLRWPRMDDDRWWQES